MITIKICDVAPIGACSYYRGIGPLSKLRHIRDDIKIEYMSGVSWYTLSDCDILYLVRPVEGNYIESMELARSFGIPVWVDFDDCLHLVPEDNPSYEYVIQKHILENIEYAIKTADIVTFSTQAIKDFYDKINPDSIVIPNAFNDYNYNLSDTANDNKIISWRGSKTHRGDLRSQKDAMVSVAKEFPDWKWIFSGGDDGLWYIIEDMPNAYNLQEMEIVRYNRFMINLKPSIHITPLLSHDFNMGKSNISWLEATSVGATSLCADLPEFRVPGAVNYVDNFAYALRKLINSKSYRRQQWEKSLTYLKENLMLSHINQKRIQIIEEVLKR